MLTVSPDVAPNNGRLTKHILYGIVPIGFPATALTWIGPGYWWLYLAAVSKIATTPDCQWMLAQ